MPATLTTPIAQPGVPVLTNMKITVDIETGAVVLLVDQSDGASNVGVPIYKQMTWGAFVTAFQAAAGSAKVKAYTVLLAQLGLTASSVT